MSLASSALAIANGLVGTAAAARTKVHETVVAGCRVTLGFDAAWAPDYLRAFLPPSPASERGSGEPFELSVLDASGGEMARAACALLAMLEERSAEARRADALIVDHAPGRVFVVDPRRRRAVSLFTSPPAAAQAARPLYGEVSLWLSFERHALLHCAGLVRDERALLVFGRGGAGKSTACARALDLGWRFLGDDRVLLECDDGGPRRIRGVYPTLYGEATRLGDVTVPGGLAASAEKHARFATAREWFAGAVEARAVEAVFLEAEGTGGAALSSTMAIGIVSDSLSRPGTLLRFGAHRSASFANVMTFLRTLAPPAVSRDELRHRLGDLFLTSPAFGRD